jgi:BCD family chlorophyll transporter-like MFS transporter
MNAVNHLPQAATTQHPLIRLAAGVVKTLRLALPKLGVGWMFALLTSNFNRIAIHDLGVAAVLITVMIGMHQFLSPFQVIFGRIADRRPIYGLRRTPYFLLGSLVASLVFLALPGLAVAMGRGSVGAAIAGFGLLTLFGIGTAASGDAHHSLIAEVTNPKSRGAVIAVVWTGTIVSAIAAAIVIKVVIGDTYTPEKMQALYNLTPWIVMITGVVGVVGIERRKSPAELAAALAQARALTPSGNPLAAALALLRQNRQVRAFFGFVLLSILGVFLQDAVLEVFGADVFNMSVKETTTFTQTWGGGVLIGMLIMGIVSAFVPLSKKLIASVGGAGTAVGLGVLTVCALTQQRALLNPALILMGFSTGLYNIGALSMMMDMTMEGATGLYMGLWGMAQAFGTGGASVLSGALKSALIETGWLSAAAGYAAIFGLETVLMVLGIALLRGVSVEQFRGLTREDLVRTMEATAAA